MADAVKKRPYRSDLRRQQAASTRAAIIQAAGDLFVAEGYARTSIRAIAERAGVAADTVYAVFGSKVRVLTAVIDDRLAPPGTANVMDRPEAQAVRTETGQRAQIERFARDIAALSTRVRPVYEVLRTAAAAEPEVRSVFDEMESYRLANMARLADWLAAHGPLLVEPQRAATIIWVLASPDVARMLCDVRGWTEAEHAEWLAASLASALLPDEAGTGSKPRPRQSGVRASRSR